MKMAASRAPGSGEADGVTPDRVTDGVSHSIIHLLKAQDVTLLASI